MSNGPRHGVWNPYDDEPMTRPQPTPSGLPETRCGLANTPGHEPHGMKVTGEWPPAGPHRRCVGYSEQPTPSAEVEALVDVFADLAWPIEDAREAAEAVLTSDWLAAYVQAARDEERTRADEYRERMLNARMERDRLAELLAAYARGGAR